MWVVSDRRLIGGRTRRCIGRAQRDEIRPILEPDFVLSISSIQTARR
jgi:hypothetical protein